MLEYKYKFAEIALLKKAALDNLNTINRSLLSVNQDFVKWKGGGEWFASNSYN